MPKIEIQISENAHSEIVHALNEHGHKINAGDNIVISKDIGIKGPYNYRQVNLRHQIMQDVVKIYKSPMIDDIEKNDSKEFIDFLDDIYNYILKGEKIENKTLKELEK